VEGLELLAGLAPFPELRQLSLRLDSIPKREWVLRDDAKRILVVHPAEVPHLLRERSTGQVHDVTSQRLVVGDDARTCSSGPDIARPDVADPSACFMSVLTGEAGMVIVW
jgi:hypothetical protein